MARKYPLTANQRICIDHEMREKRIPLVRKGNHSKEIIFGFISLIRSYTFQFCLTTESLPKMFLYQFNQQFGINRFFQELINR